MSISKHRNLCMGMLALVAIALVASRADAQTKLRWQFREGDQLLYVMQQKMNMKMSAMENNVETQVIQTLDLNWTVRGVDEEGVAQVIQKVDRIRLSLEAPNVEMEYDSNDGEFPEGPLGNSFGPVFAAMVEAEMEVTMNPLGEVLELKLPKELADELERNPAMAQMGFSVESFKQMSAQGGVSFPEEAVSKGRSWEKKTELKMPFGVAETTNEFTYKGPITKEGNQVEQIGLSVTMNIEPAPGTPLEIEMKSMESDGLVLFDNQLGRLRETDLTQHMVMEFKAMGQIFEQEIDQTISMTLVTNEDG